MSKVGEDLYSDLIPDEAQGLIESPVEVIKHGDVAYLCDYIYPFLQIARPNHSLDNLELNIINTPNGWKIMDYGEVLSVAALHDKSEVVGHGTIVQQQFDTAFTMMELAKQKGWRSEQYQGEKDEDGGSGVGELKPTEVQILDGTPMMRRFAWFAAEVLGMHLVEGFLPTDEDRKWLDKLYSSYVAEGKAAVKMQQKQ